MVVDVGEMEIERPQKNRNATESGKQKCYTIKAHVMGFGSFGTTNNKGL